ncbi:MAG TPA: sec-independent translocase [Propionibacteriaceae bacterium]|jgi:sec-independent protein translocase protein TatB|nr:sec-independent translocase [Propionibacteriaceae bacterium]
MTPLLLDINAPEFVLLIVLAIILFGPERLPDLARKAARLIRYVRTMASSAQEQLSKELGPEFENVDLRDLNPRTFVQKHLLDDVEPIIADVKSEITDVGRTVNSSTKDVTASVNGATAKDVSPGGPTEVASGNGSSRILTPYDAEAT